jgi:hypothetical protein
MSDAQHTESTGTGPAEKDPDDWTTGDEPMTGPQQSYLQTLAQQAGEDAPSSELTKAEASKLIDELQEKTGRGARG